MNQPTQEYLESSNYEETIGLQGNYTLGLGYCYVKQLNDMRLFQKNNINYRFFQTKWGYCGQNFLFSALRPDNVLILSAWANSAATCERTEKLFRIWKDILDNIITMNVPTMMIEMPAAFHRCSKDDHLIDLNLVYNRRKKYKDYVLKDLKHILCIDIYDYVSFEWEMIQENIEDKISQSPWHINNKGIEYIFNHFLEFQKNKFNKESFISGLKQL
jgi:hypothetical protein